MFGSRQIAISVVLLILALPCGCSTKVRTYDCAVEPDASAIWDCNRQIVVRAIKGKKFTLRQLDRASAFFEGLTGIPADLDRTYAGALPGEGLSDNLAAWDAWYAEQSANLRLAADGTVRLAGD